MGDDVTYSPMQLLETFEMPQKVKVAKGWMGSREEDSLGEGDEITIFFARKEQVAVAVDRAHRQHLIPVNSNYDFTLIDLNPSEGIATAPPSNDPIYANVVSLAWIVNTYKLPVTVRLKEDESKDFGTKSSAFALKLLRIESHESLYGGNAQMCDLMSIPLNLDVEFFVPDKRAHGRKRTQGSNLYAALPIYEQLVQDSELVRGVGGTSFFQNKKKAETMKEEIKAKLKEAEESIYLDILPEGNPAFGLESPYSTLHQLRPTAVGASSTPAPAAAAAESQEVSADKIKGLSVNGIGNLLRSMNLSQHVDSFAANQIDGSLFVLLDDEMLKNDLGVKSSLDRLRIRKASGNV